MKNGFANNSYIFLTGIVFIQRKIKNESACTRHLSKRCAGVLIFPCIHLKEVHALASTLSLSKSSPHSEFSLSSISLGVSGSGGPYIYSIMLRRLLILLKGFLFIFF